MLREIMFGLAVLAGTAQVVTAATGCASDTQHKRKARHASDEEEDEARAEREAAAREDLAKARTSNSEDGYRLVMKRHEGTRAADEARNSIARLRAEAAREALGKGDRKKARALAEEAQKIGDPNTAEQARITIDQIDQSDARNAGKAVKEAVAGGSSTENCKKAVDAVAETLGDNPSQVLLRAIRKETLQQLSACIQKMTESSDKMEAFAAARKVIDNPATKSAVGADTFHALSSAFNDKTVQTLVASVQPDLKANKWEGAFTTIKKWGEVGAAGTQEVEVASQQVRDAITKDLIAKGNAALGQVKAEAALADVERGLKLFEGLNVSPELKTLHSHLGTWIQCKKLGCTTAATRVSFTFGATPLLPMTSVEGSPVESLPNATKLWPLASGKGKTLVAREDPGSPSSWKDRLGAAKGWVDSSVLQKEDTSLWVPTGKALEGVRVWLPTGRDDKLYLLGMVESVSGTDVTVKKIADGQSSTVKRDVLRTGNLQRGLKVLAFCSDQLQQTPARFEEFVAMTGGAIVAKVTCLTTDGKDDKLRDVLLGSLRAQPDWLPPRKP